MDLKTLSFDTAYDSYYHQIKKHVSPGIEVLEIGGGAHPSLIDRENISYSIVDPDSNELKKAPDDVVLINRPVENLDTNKKYDLILTKMVLEHIPDPDKFHTKVYQLLRSNGRAIHFFACRHSLPAFVNRFVSERIGELILKIIKNRQLEDSPKYEAYYRKTLGHSRRQLSYFEKLGYNIETYHSFVGHKYFNRIPILKQIEQLYTWLLVQLQMKSLATVALVVLTKK